MLYKDFLDGTGAPESRETLEQFQIMNKIYADCPTMSPRELFRMWKKSYGREMKAKNFRMHQRADSLLITVEEFHSMPRIDQIKVENELAEMFWNSYNNVDGSSNAQFRSGRTYTDASGIAWGLKQVGVSPVGVIYGLFAIVDGICMDAHFSGRGMK